MFGSDGLSVGKVVPDATVEHSSVKVDASVPLEQAVVPLLVNHSLVGIVVGLNSVPPAVLLEELMRPIGHLLEVGVRLGTHHHRPAIVGLRIANVLVPTGQDVIVVVVKGADKLVIEARVLH